MPAANTAGSTHQCPPAPSPVAVLEGKGNAEGGAGRAPIFQRKRPRWVVRSYALNSIALGCGIPVEPELLSATSFRWRWMAQAWCVINRGHFAGFVFWCEIDHERPALTVINSSNSGQLPGCRTSLDSRTGTGPQPDASPGSREAPTT